MTLSTFEVFAERLAEIEALALRAGFIPVGGTEQAAAAAKGVLGLIL